MSTKIPATALADHLGAWQTRSGALRERLSAAVIDLILSGDLASGDVLPSERHLARTLAVSRNTVVAAYEILRERGFLSTTHRSGSAIAFRAGPLRKRERSLRNTFRFDQHSDNGALIDFSVAETPLPQPFERFFEDVRAYRSTGAYNPQGPWQLREAVAAYYQKRGLPTSAENILITSGGQQGISLLTELYVQRGDTVAVQNPTYFLALDALRGAGARLTELPNGESGKALREALLHRGVRSVYVIATHHNPTGYTMSRSERARFAKVIDELNIDVIEDGTLDDLSHTGENPIPLAAFSQSAKIVCIGSMNKVFWPGLRVGWIRASKDVIARLVTLRTIADLGNNLVSQAVALRVFAEFERVRAHRQAELREKLRCMSQAMQQLLPEWTYAEPEGGFSLWASTPLDDAQPFTQFAQRFGVKTICGTSMALDHSCARQVRLVFSGPENDIREGVRRLSHAWRLYASRERTTDLPGCELIV
jgi:DNA-binding transcriptional MocR family regulator